jgi:2-amino-4-hydroxy-6-hydroxymethyldihydropteridine diphosphokinase
MIRAYIGLGSNVGDRLANLRRAVGCLGAVAGIQVIRVSSVYETEPIGVTDQGWFLNAVAEIATSLSPTELLERIQHIERELGRLPAPRWGPRVIDLDILLYDDVAVRTAALEIPHPGLQQRAFVLVPLLELEPACALPNGAVLSRCLAQLQPPQRVRLFASPAALAPAPDARHSSAGPSDALKPPAR